MKPYTGYIIDDVNFKILCENNVMVVGFVNENSYCFNKITKEEIGIFQFDNNPTCALLARNNDWCLVGGDVLALRTWFDNMLWVIDDIKQVFDLKLIDDNKVHILIDPWSKDSAIWQLTIRLHNHKDPFELVKVCDFTEYLNKPYSENIKW